MLWIEKYRPRSFEALLGQESVVSHLANFAASGTLPHLLLTGPHGTGKSCAVECLASSLFGVKEEENLTIIQTRDLFEIGKKYLEDERYAHIYRRDESLLTNFKNITRWYASIRPLDSEFRILVFEEASALPREAQQGLRRILERYSRTCRFIFVTSTPAGIIPAISSRCLPFFFAPIPAHLIEARIREIAAREITTSEILSDDTIDLIVQTAGGDLRKAVMLLELCARSPQPFDLLRCSQTETGQITQAAFIAMRDGDIASAIRRIETLMIEYGLTSREVLGELRAVVRREYDDPRIIDALADTDYLIGHCNNEYVQLNALIARISREVFS